MSSTILNNIKNSFNTFKDSFNVLRTNIYLFLAIMFFDILFFIVYGFIDAQFFQSLSDSAVQFLQGLMGNTNVSSYFYSTLFYYFLFLIIFYSVYCVIQGASWFFAYRTMKKVKGTDFSYWCFFKLNLLWMPILFFLVTFQYLRRIAGVINHSNTDFGDYVFYFVIYLLVYLAIISYSNNSFSIKKSIDLENILFMILITSLFIILNLILKLTLNYPYLTLILGFITVIPLIAIARIGFIKINKIN